METCIRLLR